MRHAYVQERTSAHQHVSMLGLELEYSFRYFPDPKLTKRLFPDGGQSARDEIEIKRNKLVEIFARAFLKARDVFPLGPRFGFMVNGGRAYLDGQIFEMATPECSNPEDVTRRLFANEALLLDQIGAMNDRLARGGFHGLPGGRVEISKKTSNFRGNDSYGCHENFQIRRFEPRSGAELFRETRRRLLRPLAPFLISRQPFIGAGNLTNRAEFVVSPRGIMTSIGIATSAGRSHGSTPLAFIRRDGDTLTERSSSSDVCETEYARLQVCCSDGNVSSLQTEFKLGTTAIVLRMIEEGYLTASPVILLTRREAMQTVAEDTTLTARLETKNGNTITALELNRLYFLRARRFFETHPRHGWEARTMVLWEEWLRKLSHNPAALDAVLDWRILLRFVEFELERKFHLTLRELQERLSDPWNEAALSEAFPILRELQWKMLNYFFIYDCRFRETLTAMALVDDELLSPQNMVGAPECFMPPADTRAAWRVRLMRFMRSRGWQDAVVAVGWGLFQFRNRSNELTQFVNDDPRNATLLLERGVPLSDDILLAIANE